MVSQTEVSEAARFNRSFYSQTVQGRSDYWRKMAAPRFRRATILKLLTCGPARRIVDLGCGGGQLLCEIAARLPDALLAGVDLSLEQLAGNQSALSSIEWWALDLCGENSVPPDLLGRFDTVVASELIEHVENPLQLLQNARLLAEPGARLLLSTQSGPVRQTERRVGHVRHFSASEMQSLLVESGWCPVKIWNAGFPFHDLSKWWANRDPEKTMDRFGDRAYGWYENLVCYLLRWLFLFNSQRYGAQLFATAVASR